MYVHRYLKPIAWQHRAEARESFRRMTVERFGKNPKGIHTAAVLNYSGPRSEDLTLECGKATKHIFMSTRMTTSKGSEATGRYH